MNLIFFQISEVETIGNLEKGRYNPSLVLAWNIAKTFHVTIEEVFTVIDD